MSILLKHQTIAVLLAAIFGIFNVGVPIVIASCQMTDYGLPPVCSACSGGSNANVHRLTNQKDTSCCATVIAADRNTTEFVQSKMVLSHVERMDIIGVLPSMVESSTGYSSLFTLDNHSPSPPRFEDITIFNSSLLI